MGRTLLERWLSQRVGYCIRLDSRNVGQQLYDGRVFYDLLASYGVVNIEMFGGIPGRGKKSEDEAFRSLSQLCDAFRFLNVDVNEEYLRGIAKRNGPFAVRLLYQLYIKLEDKQFLDLLAPKRDDSYDQATKKSVMILHKKFRRRDLKDSDTAENEINIVKQYEDAKRRIITHCAEDIARRREVLNRIQNQFTPIDFKAGGEPSYLSRLKAMVHEEEEETFDLDPKEYVDSLKAKERQRRNNEYQAIKMTPHPVVDVWTDILERMDDAFKSKFKKTMDQQADYEKFHALKWSVAHHKFKRFFETKMDRYVDSDEEDLTDHVVKNEILRKGGEAIGKKQEPMWKLHRKLWAKKKRQRKRCNYEMCRHIVQDLVDILMKVLLYRFENKRAPVPRRLMNDWKESFFRCELTSPPPRITVVESSIGEEEAHPEDELMMDLLKDRDFDSEIFIDREVIKLLNEFNMHCYMYLVGPWDPLNWPDWEARDENLVVNGFIVHRLLESKYPLPKGYQDPQFDFKFKAALSSIKDPNTAYIYNTMRNLMTKQETVVLDIIEPMNYCLNTYHAETAAIEDQIGESVGVKGGERRQSKRRQSKRQSKSGSQGRKSSAKGGGRKSMGAKQRKSTGGSARKSNAGGRKSNAGGRKSNAGGRKSNAGGRKSNAGGRKSSAGSRKSMGGGQRKSMGGGKKKSMAGGGKKSIVPQASPTKGRNKAVQCPSIDSLIPRVNHSPAGLLGKEAFDFLNSGRPVSDLLSGKMLIEYLKVRKNSIKGLTLLSYPLTVSQAVLLEFLMTGRPLKTNYKISPEIEKFIHDELRPQPYLDTRVLVEFENIFTPDLQTLSEDILDVMADPVTAKTIKAEHNKMINKHEGLEAINATLTAVADALPKEKSAKTLKEGSTRVVIDLPMQTTTDHPDIKSEIDHTIVEYPGWELKCYNERTPSKQELAEKIRTIVYNIGRFRPQLSSEAYEKLMAHALGLINWIRSGRKRVPKPTPDVEVFGEMGDEQVESVGNRTEGDPKSQNEPKRQELARPMNVTLVTDTKPMNVSLRPEEYRRPITYVELLKLRSSEIMPRPNKDQMEIHYSTSSFFSKYIKCLTTSLAKKEEEEYKARKLKYDKFMADEMPGEEFVLDPIIEAQPDSYYKVYGKKEVFDFASIDYDSITRLCRMIIDEPWDDDDPQRKPSVILFDADSLKKLRADLPGRKRSSRTSKKGRPSTGGKRQSTARRASKRKSTGGKRKSTARQSTASKRKSAAGKRQSAAGKRKSAAGKRQSAAGKRQSAAGKRQSAAGKRKSSGGQDTRRTTTMKGGKKKDSDPSKAVPDEEKKEEEQEEEIEQIAEVEEQPLPPPPPPPPIPPPPPPPTPGEEGWVYVEEFIPEIYQIYLATTWEAIEFEYLSDLLHIFYLMRTHDNKVIPYRNFVRKEMESSLLHTDKRMETVTAFQKAFNDIKPKLRRQSDIKRGLHCRVYALYNDLVDIADEKRNAALARREELLNQRWASKHLFTLSNLFFNLIQIEMDRTIESLQLIHDYYFAMLQKPPSKERLELMDIPKLYIPKREASTLTVEEASTKKVLLPWEKADEKPPVPDYVLQAVDVLDYLMKNSVVKSIDPNPTHNLISRAIGLTNTRSNALFDFYEDLILDSELGRELRPKILKKLSPEEEKERRKQEKAFRKMLARRKQKKVLERSPSEGRDSQPRKMRKKKPILEMDEEEEQELVEEQLRTKFYIDSSKLQMVDRLKWEWLVAVQNEINRLGFRLNLIRRKAEAELDEVLTILKAGFDEFFHDIGWQYRREIKAIEQVIDAFKAAIDLEVDIPAPMILDNDEFYFGTYPKMELHPEVQPPPNTPIITIPKDFVFTIQQLNNFIRKIEDVSPEGIIERGFVDILEDMAAFNREMNYEFLPPGWSELKRNDIRFLIEQAFGSDFAVNWRDFLLFCSGLRYPTVEEIVEMRMRFREVDEFGLENIQYSSYMNIPLWFEKDLETEEDFAWGQQMKNVLFKLFRTSRKEINYTELLLTLCKGKEPEEGFGKALSLMVGVGYIFWPDPPDWVHPRHVVDYILIQLLHDVIIKADYVTVTDYVPEQEEEEDVEIPELGEEEVWGEVDPTEILKMVDEHLGEEMEEEAEEIDKYKQILWRTCVPYEACLALLFVALRFWELPPSHMLRQLDLETGLRKLFVDQGVGTHMKAYKLAQSGLITNIFHNTSAFKECNMPEMVYHLTLSKRHVVGSKNLLEGIT